MGVLRRKRMYEQQRDQLAGQAFNVEQTNFAIDSVKDTLTTVQAMKTASKTLKKEVKKGSGKCANGPVDHTCNASGHWACLWECSHWSWHSTC